MKAILLGLYLFGTTAFAADQTPDKSSVDRPSVDKSSKIPDCFKVNRLLKIDATFYWAEWTNACPFTVETVYVMVTFVDHSGKELGAGVWPMYFIQPGVHRVTRFTAPVGVSVYETLRVTKITTDSAIALIRDQRAVDAAVHQTSAPGKVRDLGLGPVTHISAKPSP
ncbi:MAG TPA: hypothetical protein VGG72_17330 [Bryobacteraceae bacterium]|jgi:hypothetical protein